MAEEPIEISTESLPPLKVRSEFAATVPVADFVNCPIRRAAMIGKIKLNIHELKMAEDIHQLRRMIVHDLNTCELSLIEKLEKRENLKAQIDFIDLVIDGQITYAVPTAGVDTPGA